MGDGLPLYRFFPLQFGVRMAIAAPCSTGTGPSRCQARDTLLGKTIVEYSELGLIYPIGTRAGNMTEDHGLAQSLDISNQMLESPPQGFRSAWRLRN